MRKLLGDGAPVGVAQHVDPIQPNLIEHRERELGELGDGKGQQGQRALTDAGGVEADDGPLAQRAHERVPTL